MPVTGPAPASSEQGAACREIIGKHDPALTAVEFRALVEDRARLEIEVTTEVPELTSRSLAT